jgi:ComEC/Rec2-related protein
MTLMAHSLVTLAVFFVLGIALSARLPLVPGVLLGIIATVLCAALMVRRAGQRSLAHALVLALVMVSGALRAQLASPLNDPTHYLTQNAFGSGRFELEVTDDPVPSGDVWRMSVAMRAIWTGDKKAPASGSARLVMRRPKEDQRAPVYGDVLEVDGMLASPRDAYAGPGTHLKDLWAAEGVHGVIYAERGPRVTRETGGNPVFGLLFGLRHRISEVLDQTHPPEVAAFIRTILLGMRDLPTTAGDGAMSATLQDFRVTGTYHLLSISGCQVGILALILGAVLGAVFSRKTTSLFVLAALAAYAVLSGGSAPVVRASLMAGVFIFGQLLYRPLTVFTALAAAALIILAVSPLSLFLPGFQMSFLAVLSIAYLTPPLMTRLDYLPPYLNALVSTSLAATFGTAPILALATGKVSLVAPLANLLVVPLFGIIMPVSMAAVIGSLVSPWIPFFFGAANYGFVTLFSGTVHLLATLPGAALDVTRFSPNVWVAYGLGLVILGDWHNLRMVLFDRLSVSQGEPDTPAPEHVDSSAVARAARELVCLLPDDTDDPDPLSRRLAAVRGIIRGQAQDLAPEFMLRFDGLTKEPWAAALDQLTLAYIALSEAYFLAARSPDKGPALLLLLKALEHELNVHLFRPILLAGQRKGINTYKTRYPNNRLVNWLASPPVLLTLTEQDELIWSVLTTNDRSLKSLVRTIARSLGETVADPDFFLNPSRFPLRLNQTHTRFYLRLDKEDWNWENIRKAREEILGPTRENLFEQIGRALSKDAAAQPAAMAAAAGGGAREASRPVGPADPGAGAPGVQEVHRLEDDGQEEVRDEEAQDHPQDDRQGAVEIHAGSSLKPAG